MTFLAYSFSGDSIYACMDTLGKSENGDGFLEKAFYLKNNHILLCVKGEVNLSFPLIGEVIKMDAQCNLQEIEKFIFENINERLKEFKTHSWAGHDSSNTIRLLYWEDNKPMVSIIDNARQEYFIFSRKELSPGIVVSNNNMDWESLLNSNHEDEIRKLYSGLTMNHQDSDVTAQLGTLAYVSRVNDPPASYTGGKIFLYSLSVKDFSQKLIHTFDDYQDNLFIPFAEVIKNLGESF